MMRERRDDIEKSKLLQHHLPRVTYGR